MPPKPKPSEEQPLKLSEEMDAGVAPDPIDELVLCSREIFVWEQEILRRDLGPCPEIWRTTPTGDGVYSQMYRALEVESVDLEDEYRLRCLEARGAMPARTDQPCGWALFIMIAVFHILHKWGEHPSEVIPIVAAALDLPELDVAWMRRYLRWTQTWLRRGRQDVERAYITARDVAIEAVLNLGLISAREDFWPNHIANKRAAARSAAAQS